MQNNLFHFDLQPAWQEKIRLIHQSKWHGQLEEAGTGSWVQSLLQTQAGASSTLDASHTRYAYEAQSQAYPDVPESRSLSLERVRHWADYLLTHEPTQRPHCFALAMSGGLQTLNEPPERDHHAWIALSYGDVQHVLHVRLKAKERLQQQMALGLLGIDLLFLLAQNTLTPSDLDIALQPLLEIDVWHVSDETASAHLARNVALLQRNWTPMVVLSAGKSQRYVESLRGEHLLVEKGSFNPVTLAHEQLLAQAKQLQPLAKAVFELSVDNVDKGRAIAKDFIHRLQMLALLDPDVLLTQTPTLLETRNLFLEQAQAKQVDFVCGTDLYHRVFMAKYYPEGIKVALDALFAHNTQLYVAGRPQASYASLPTTSEEASFKTAYAGSVTSLPVQQSISSSQVRRAVQRQDQKTWQKQLPQKVCQYIIEHGLYLESILMSDFNYMTQKHESPTDFWQTRYASSVDRNRGKAGKHLQQQVATLRPARVLELGCSTGDDSLWLAEQGWQVTAVDLSEQAIKTAQRLAQEAKLDHRIQFQARDLSTDLPDREFELVVALYFQSPYERFPRLAILKNAATRIVPGGHLLIVTHATGPSWANFSERMPAMPTAEGDWAELALPTTHWKLEKLSVETRLHKGPEGQEEEVKDNVILARRL